MKMSELIIAVMMSSSRKQCKELARNLKPEGVQVSWFLEKEIILEYCQKIKPQIVILDPPFADVQLAGMIQAIHGISDDPKILKIPILVLSNLGRSNNASILDAGADYILEKPFTTTAVVTDIRTLTRRDQIERKNYNLLFKA